VATPAPTPYAGSFLAAIDGGPAFPLSAFGGCVDVVIGVEYDDCYFATLAAPAELFAWANDAAQRPSRHDVTVYQVDFAGLELTEMSIRGGFLREFAVSELDAASNGAVVFTFVVVPEDIRTTPGDGLRVTVGAQKLLQRSNFRVSLDGVDGRGVSAVRGLRMSAAKVPAPPTGGVRRQFEPGAVAYAGLTLEVAAAGQVSTAADLDAWLAAVAAGSGQPADGSVQLLNSALTDTEVVVELFAVSPTSFPPFQSAPGRRTFTAALGRFEVR